MGEKRVSDLTIEEFKTLVYDLVDERLQHWQPTQKPVKKRSLKEILDSIDRHRWTPPPGAKSTWEMLREDRDS
ncbi:hypothetical protein [Floridanema aerugineum]|uniref:Uncharacterized protein n=1 Tax=Floridaenema aerugineum BLCC-F46 TaxID=3153654 RepID=A0ABV4XEU2_9CYAN